jgi:hypothetical protein
METITYRGKEWIKEETETSVILTSLEKKNGRKVILEFTKDEEKSDQAIENFKEIMRKSIIDNLYRNK